MKDYNLDFLSKLKDHPGDLEKCVDFLYLLQIKQGPLVEVITVLKNEKPRIYSLLKGRVSGNRGLSMLFEFSIDYDYAKSVVYKLE
jgi:sulfite reductase alpha subunit-like flavoprotein